MSDMRPASYECNFPWPSDSQFMIYQDEKEFNFDAVFSVPENISAQKVYVTGEGIQNKKIVVTGRSVSLNEAESLAYLRYAEITSCEHSWYKNTLDGKDLLLNGDCTCTKCKVHVKNLQMDQKLFNAMNLAHEAHDGQFRKYNNQPYISHPKRVYEDVSWYLPTPEPLPMSQRLLMAKAAWLHDVLEDCPQITKERIINEVDEETYNLILELTNPSKGSKEPRAVRKQMDRDHLKHVSWEAKIIKLLDRAANLSDLESDFVGNLATGPDKGFLSTYAAESRLLLECLKDTDEQLEKLLLTRIVIIEDLVKE